MARPFGPSPMRIRPASPPGVTTELPRISVSYCSQTQRFEHWSGEPTSFSSASRFDIGGVTSTARITGRFGVGSWGRSYSGASSPSSLIGMSAMTRPPCFTTKRRVSVVLPTTAKSSPHLRKMASAGASWPGLITMSMRSWLSESIIS